MAKARATSKANNSAKFSQQSQTEQTASNKEEVTYDSECQPTAEQEPPRRGRGRPKKITVADAAVASVDEGPATTDAVPTKRVRMAVTDADTQPVAKRKKTDEAATDNPLLQPGKAATSRRTADITPRDALPDRKGRNVHPAPMKPTRRSSQQVEADREEKRRAIEKKIRELEEAKRLLAEMNALEDVNDDMMDEANPQRLSVALRKRQHIELEDDSRDESFNFKDVDDMPSSSEGEDEAREPEPVQDTMAKVGRKKVKVTLRKDVEDMVRVMHAQDDGRKSKRMKPTDLKFPTLDAEPKKYARSGLRKDLKAKKVEETFDPFQSGGLDDEDAASTRPSFPRTQGPRPELHALVGKDVNLKRDHSRKNNLVQIKEEGSEDEKAPIKRTRKAKKVKDPNPTQGTGRQPKTVVPANQTAAESSGNGVNTADYFVKDWRWTRIFLPSLTHALYTSREPFEHFRSDSPEFLATVQAAFNASFGNINFTLSFDDAVTVAAYKRIKSKKSLLASDILELVTKFFNGPEFTDQPAAIRQYVQWALKYGGPAYYKVPTPKEWKGLNKSDPDYKAPEGFLESQFITPIARQYLKYATNSALSPAISRQNPPKGLYALILVAVERAFFAHRKGTLAKPAQFNSDNSAKPLQDFLKSIDKVKEERWFSILQFSGDEDEVSDAAEDSILQADLSMISAYRAGAYVSSSPVKS